MEVKQAGEKPEKPKQKCSVCGDEGYDFLVAASSLGAWSDCYCWRCLRAGYEPYDALVTTAACVSYDNLTDYVKETVRRTLQFLGITLQQFMIDVAKADEELRNA